MPDLEILSVENSQSKANYIPRVQHKTGTVKLDYIDALRGIAALSILIYHLYGVVNIATNWIYPIQIIPERFIGLTMAGVPLFFIISSFTLYLSLDNKLGERRKFLKFYIRRFFRIAPLFYVLLIYVMLDELIIQKRAPSRLEVLSNFTFTFNLIPQYAKSLFSDGWTVGVEMLFYLFLPLIYIKVNNIRRSIIFFIGVYFLSQAGKQLVGMIIGEDVMRSTTINYDLYNFFHWAPIFPIGIICYLIYKLYLPKVKREYRTPATLSMFLISIVILFYTINNLDLSLAISDRFEPLVKLTNMQIMSPIAFCLMILSLSLFANRIIVNRITRFYGMISYSFYLVHPFLVDPLRPAYSYIYAHTIFSTDLSFCLCLLITLLIVTPVSLITYRFIESPGMRYGKRIIAKL